MITSLEKAFSLLLNPTDELLNILAVTARMSLTSSLISLILGAALGLWLGSRQNALSGILTIITRTLMGMPPVVCGLILYILFSGVGPFRHLRLMFTVPLMILAQILLITPIVASTMESWTRSAAPPVRECCMGMGLSRGRYFSLLAGESRYQIITAFLMAFSRSIAEVGAVSMVGGAIAWKTNVMTTAIMMYTNRGDFTLGVALGIILLMISLAVNILVTLMQRRLAA